MCCYCPSLIDDDNLNASTPLSLFTPFPANNSLFLISGRNTGIENTCLLGKPYAGAPNIDPGLIETIVHPLFHTSGNLLRPFLLF